MTILTNEWTDSNSAKPIVGRPCAVVAEYRENRKEDPKQIYAMAMWNGNIWVDANLGVQTKEIAMLDIKAWYMIFKYKPKNNE